MHNNNSRWPELQMFLKWIEVEKSHILLHGDRGQGGNLREENEFDSEILTGWILTIGEN